MDEDPMICRICFKIIQENIPFTPIVNNSVILQNLNLIAFATIRNLQLTEDPLICEGCLTSLKEYAFFKENVITNEFKIQCHQKKDINIFLTSLSPDSERICRLCLKTNPTGPYFTKYWKDNKKMFVKCNIHLNLHILKPSRMCDDCFGMLDKMYKFVCTSIERENEVVLYFTSHQKILEGKDLFAIFNNIEKKLQDKIAEGDESGEPEPVLLDPKDIQIKIKRVGSTYEVEDNNNKASTSKKEAKKASKKRLKAKKKKRKKESKTAKITEEDKDKNAVDTETIDLTETETNLKNSEELSKEENSEETIDLTEKVSEVVLNQDMSISPTAMEVEENNVRNKDANNIYEQNVVDLTSELEVTPEKPLEKIKVASKKSPKESPSKAEALQTKRSARIACRTSLLKKTEFNNKKSTNDVAHGTNFIEHNVKTAKITKCTKITVTEPENTNEDIAETSLDQEMLQITEYVSKITETSSSQTTHQVINNVNDQISTKKYDKSSLEDSNEDLIKILTGEDDRITDNEKETQTDLPYYASFKETENIEPISSTSKLPERNLDIEFKNLGVYASKPSEANLNISNPNPIELNTSIDLNQKNNHDSILVLPKLSESYSTIELRSKNKFEVIPRLSKSFGASTSVELKPKSPQTPSRKRTLKTPEVPSPSLSEKKLNSPSKPDDSIFDFTEEEPEDLPPRLSKRTKVEVEDVPKKSPAKDDQKKKEEDIMSLIKKAFEFTEDDEENQQEVTSQKETVELSNSSSEKSKGFPRRTVRRLVKFNKNSVLVSKVSKIKPSTLKMRRTMAKNGKTKENEQQSVVKQPNVNRARSRKQLAANARLAKQNLKNASVIRKAQVKVEVRKLARKPAAKKPEDIQHNSEESNSVLRKTPNLKAQHTVTTSKGQDNKEQLNPVFRKGTTLKARRTLKTPTVVAETTNEEEKTPIKAAVRQRRSQIKEESIKSRGSVTEALHRNVSEGTTTALESTSGRIKRESKRSIQFSNKTNQENRKSKVQSLNDSRQTYQNGLSTDGDIEIHQVKGNNTLEDEYEDDDEEEVLLPNTLPSKIISSALIKPPGKFLNVSKAVKGKRRSKRALEEAFDRLVEGKPIPGDEQPTQVTVLEEPLEEEEELDQSSSSNRKEEGNEIQDTLQELHSLFTSSNKMLECTRCTYKTRSLDMFNQHKLIHTVLDSVQKFKCQLCSFQCKTKEQIDIHNLSHKNRDPTEHFACIYCDFHTKKKVSLVNHIIRHKDEVSLDEFYCLVLEYANTSSETMKCFECLQCDMQCDEDTEMKEHLKVHNDPQEYDVRMYRCDMCKYQTKEEMLLRRHHQTVHTKSQRNKCRVCRFRSRHDDILKKHEEVHIINGELPPPEDIDQEHKCVMCPYVTMNKRSLSNHISQKHTKPVITKKEKKTNDDVEAGEEKRTGKETYRCAECPYTTNRKMNMPRHALVHKTKENMLFFECNYCVFETKHRRSYTRHMNSMHNIKV